MYFDDVPEPQMLPYAEAVRELVGLAHLCERAKAGAAPERMRGAVDMVSAIYGVPRPDVVLDLKAALALEGIEFN